MNFIRMIQIKVLAVLLAGILSVGMLSFFPVTAQAMSYTDTVTASTAWNGGNRVGPITISGGTEDDPIVIKVNGTVTVEGEIDITAGSSVVFTGGGTLKRSDSYINQTEERDGYTYTTKTVYMISLGSGCNIELDSITLDGNYNEDETGALIWSGHTESNRLNRFVMNDGAVLKNNYQYGVNIAAAQIVINGGVVTGIQSEFAGGYAFEAVCSDKFTMNGGSIHGNSFYNGTTNVIYESSGLLLSNVSEAVITGGSFYDNDTTDQSTSGGDIIASSVPSLELDPQHDISISSMNTFSSVVINEDTANPIVSCMLNGAETTERTLTGTITDLAIKVASDSWGTAGAEAQYTGGGYTVSGTAGAGGSIAVNDQGAFKIAASQDHYVIDAVYVDGVEQPDLRGLTDAVYTFPEGTAGAHAISAVFSYTLDLSDPGNGTVTVKRITGTSDGAGETAEAVTDGTILHKGDILELTAGPADGYTTGDIVTTGLTAVSGTNRYEVTADLGDVAPELGIGSFLSPPEVFQKAVGLLQKSAFTYDSSYESYLNSISAAYSVLTDTQKQDTDISAAYGILDYYQQAFSVYADIYQIGTVTYDESCLARITAARSGYDALPRQGCALVSDAAYKVLTDAEHAYHDLDFTQAITIGSTLFKDDKASVTYGKSAFSLNAVTSGNGKLYYASSDESVATVSTDGTVTVVGTGTAQITVTAMDTYQYDKAEKTVELTVLKKAQTITASPGTIAATFRLNAKTDGDGSLSYQSSNTGIATVDAAGNVTVKGAGTVRFTVTASGTDHYQSASKAVSVDVTAVKGSLYTVGSLKYQVISAKTDGTGTVSVKKYTGTGTGVTIGSTVKIGNHSYKITEIQPSAFQGCKALKSVAIGTQLRVIGAKAFYGCKGLTRLEVHSPYLNKVGDKALAGTGKGLAIKVPGKKLSAYKKLFAGKGQGSTAKIGVLG